MNPNNPERPIGMPSPETMRRNRETGWSFMERFITAVIAIPMITAPFWAPVLQRSRLVFNNPSVDTQPAAPPPTPVYFVNKALGP